MAIRFTSFEAYKRWLADKETGAVSSKATFIGMRLPNRETIRGRSEVDV